MLSTSENFTLENKQNSFLSCAIFDVEGTLSGLRYTSEVEFEILGI